MSAELDETQETKNLSQLFEDGYALFENISNSDQPTNSTDIQVKYIVIDWFHLNFSVINYF